MSQEMHAVNVTWPHEVRFVRLPEVARIRNGRDYKHLDEGRVPVYGTGGVMAFVDQYAYDKPSVLIPRKGSLDKLYYVDEAFWTVDTIYYTEIDGSVVPKFLYYYLLTQHLEEMNQAGGVPSLTQAMLSQVKVPVPPLEVQREIVRILDTFTELEAELEARTRQYSYYRTTMLSKAAEGAPVAKLGSLAEIGTGSSDRVNAVIGGKFPLFVRSKEVLAIDAYEFDEEAVVIPGEGGLGDIFHYVNGKYGLHQRAYRIHPTTDVLDGRFLYFFLKAEFGSYIKSRAVNATVTSIRKPMLTEMNVPVPALAEQRRIVSVLNQFDRLIHDLSGGLPAELHARRTQYEYYRDRLLTFDELPDE